MHALLTCARLAIKSQAPSAASGTPAYAVLCTPSKTFQLRQVQTSNSLFVTQPARDAHGNETRAIASCTATLELVPSSDSAVAYLEQQLPVFDILDGLVDCASNAKSKAAIFASIPLSDAQCEQAWRELMAFETSGHSHRPSARALALVWKSLNTAALAEGVKLGSQFLAEDMVKALAEEQYPPELLASLFRRLATDDQDPNGPWSCLDRSKTVAFVGRTLLDARRGESDYLTADFLDAWRDCLPEAWSKDAELKAIDGAYHLTSASTIRLKGGAPAAAEANATPTAKAGGTARKWHEKFGKTRKR